MLRTLLRVLLVLAVAGLIYWLGTLLIAALGAPAVFLTIWLVVVVIVVLLVIARLFGVTI